MYSALILKENNLQIAEAWVLTTMTVPLSVLIPTRNEIGNLRRCLEPLLEWAQEIVVVDSHSTDGTSEYAQSIGATLLQFNYTGGWPKKRQWALDTYMWRSDWILLLDADEILTSDLKREIEKTLKQPTHDGYLLRLEIVFLGRQLRYGGTMLRKLSLFRRGKAWFEKRLEDQDASMADMEVHEHVIMQSQPGELKSAVRHENTNSLFRYIQKQNEYSNWSARVLTSSTDTELKPSLWGSQAQRRRFLLQLFWRLPGSPLALFLLRYVLQLGFLDGKPGLIYQSFFMIQMLQIKAKIFELELHSGR